jgi:protocatechuate 3,4-dioxygenase alpha subunit
MKPSAEMTVGPFFPPEFARGADDLAVAGSAAIQITGRVTQADGKPLDNLVLELWQADARGIYSDPADPRHKDADSQFYGWGRTATDADGNYRFRTVMPGARDGRAPHVNLLLLFSGLVRQLHTAVFFAEAPADPVFAAVPAARRPLLVAKEVSPGRYRFDIRLRGENETPFFDD